MAVVARHASAAPRVAGRLEEIYLSSADDLLAMIVQGDFPGEADGGDSVIESVAFERVGHWYVKDERVLEDVSFTLHPGMTLALAQATSLVSVAVWAWPAR